MNNTQIEKECETIKYKYSSMTAKSANLFFSFELQGYVAAMIDHHKFTMEQVFVKIIDLMGLLEKAQGGKK